MRIVIPARKGTKDKAMWKLAGRPLIDWVVSACPPEAEIHVTTDSGEVAEYATEAGATVDIRPWWLGTPSSLVVDALPSVSQVDRHILVQPTAPFVRRQDILACHDALSHGVTSQTVIPVQHNAHWMNQRTMDGFIHERAQNSQGKPAAYQFGNCIGYKAEARKKRNLYLEPSIKIEIPRFHGIDIDDEDDLKLAEAILDKGLVDL